MIAIHTKYLPATDTRGSRIKAYTATGRSVTVPLDHSLDGHKRHFTAVKVLVEKFLPYAPSVENMVYGDSADGKGYVFCFGESKVSE